ncbi:hypothetical protein, partial [Ruthenibacterium lactatiformans]|uniref:hypothetical protein n=1 Tax=Ruthenibacterium lactatiformans TaxID=1550024 RepID=UPI0026DD1DEF
SASGTGGQMETKRLIETETDFLRTPGSSSGGTAYKKIGPVFTTRPTCLPVTKNFFYHQSENRKSYIIKSITFFV